MSGIPASQPCTSPYLSHLFPDKPASKVTQNEYEYELRIDLDFPPQHQNIFTMDILVTPKIVSVLLRISRNDNFIIRLKSGTVLYPGLLQPLITLD